MGAPLTDQPAIEAALLRPLTDVEAGFVNQADTGLIAQASGQLRNKLRTIDDRIASADPTDPTGIDPSAVKAMLADVIARLLLNPKRLWSETNSAGPLSTSATYPGARGGAGAASTSGLVVTDDDVASILPPVATDGYVPAGTIRTRPPHLLGPIGPRW